jgi:hypothetical protein
VIALSKSKAKNAARLGGIELLVLWPAEFGDAPSDIAENHERDANDSERRHARALVRDACKEHRLSVIAVRVCNRHRVGSLAVEPGVHRIHLSIHIVGDDWADKTIEAGKRGIEMFHVPAGRPEVGAGRRPRNIMVSDEVYAMLERAGDGRAAEGLEIVARAYLSSGR